MLETTAEDQAWLKFLNLLSEQDDSAEEDPDLAQIICLLRNGDRHARQESHYLAVKNLQLDVMKGSTWAMEVLSSLYRYGWFIHRDFNKAMELLQQAADHDDVEAMIEYADMLAEGREGCAVDLRGAYVYYSKAAILVDPHAMYRVGDFYRDGLYVTEDPRTALALYRYALDMVKEVRDDIVETAVRQRLRDLEEKGIQAAPAMAEDENFSPALIHKAEDGDIPAMVQVADYIFFTDRSEEVEPELVERGLRYYQTAIQAGNHRAMVDCGLLYWYGNGVPKNYPKAVQLLRLAAQEGDPVAADYLGSWFLTGERKIPVDHEQAYLWFSKAALLGNIDGYISCSDMFRWSNFVHHDPEASFDLLQIVEGCTNPVTQPRLYADACYRLGVELRHGIGCGKDLERAKEYFAQAEKYYLSASETGDHPDFCQMRAGMVEAMIKEIEEKMKEQSDRDERS